MDEAEITQTLQSELSFYKVKVQAKQKEDQLHILVTRSETNDIDYDVLFEVIKSNLEQLVPASIKSFTVYGRLAKVKQPEWQKSGELEITAAPDIDPMELIREPIDDFEPVSSNNDDTASFLLDEKLESLEIPDYRYEPESSQALEDEINPSNNSLPTSNKPTQPQRGLPWIPIAVAGAAVVVIGAGWFFWDRSVQEGKITEAQAIASKVPDPKQLGKLEALTNAQQELKKASDLLQEVPDRPGSPYEQAQAQLTPIRQKLALVDKKLDTEQVAKSNLEAAKKLAQEATSAVQTPALSLQILLSAQSKWQEAIKTLEKIPQGTLAYDEASKKLADYRKTSVSITAQVQKQRLLENATAAWGKQVPANVQAELKKLKASGLPPVQFAKKCSERVLPTLNAGEIQAQGFQPNAAAASICNNILSAK